MPVRRTSTSDGNGAPSSGPTAARTPPASGSAGSGCGTPTSSISCRRARSREIKGIFDDAGLTYLEVEFLADFFAAPGSPERAESDERRRLLFDAAATFGAHHIKVGNIPGTPCELERLTEEFAALCDDARDHTDATIVYEFMPFDVNVHDAGRGADRSCRAPGAPTADWRSTPGT